MKLNILISTPCIMCRICLDLLYLEEDMYVPNDSCSILTRHKLCSCGNVGIIIDEDATTRIYVDDIRTTQRALLWHIGDFREVRRVLLRPFSKELFLDYKFIKTTSLTYQTYAKKNNYTRKTSTKYNTKLIKSLERYKYTTSDGEEEFLRTALTNPLREA